MKTTPYRICFALSGKWVWEGKSARSTGWKVGLQKPTNWASKKLWFRNMQSRDWILKNTKSKLSRSRNSKTCTNIYSTKKRQLDRQKENHSCKFSKNQSP